VRDALRYSRLDGVIKDVETEREYAQAFLTPGAPGVVDVDGLREDEGEDADG
jgi:hypothetical protein